MTFFIPYLPIIINIIILNKENEKNTFLFLENL